MGSRGGTLLSPAPVSFSMSVRLLSAELNEAVGEGSIAGAGSPRGDREEPGQAGESGGEVQAESVETMSFVSGAGAGPEQREGVTGKNDKGPILEQCMGRRRRGRNVLRVVRANRLR